MSQLERPARCLFENEWFHGPTSLCQDEKSWPSTGQLSVACDVDLESVATVHVAPFYLLFPTLNGFLHGYEL